jgi:acyl dehydratase
MYAGASGDYNPLHTDEVYATVVADLPSVIAHGQLTMGMTIKVVTDWIDDCDITTFGVRFQRQVWPDDTLTVSAVVTAVNVDNGCVTVDVDLTTKNQHGEQVVSGYATLQERK